MAAAGREYAIDRVAAMRGRMRKLIDQIINLLLRYLGRYSLDDPRPIAVSAPYTFFLPLEEKLARLEVGDWAQLIFRGRPRGRKWDAERMWVRLTRIEGRRLTGVLDSEPFDLPQLRPGARIRFERHQIIAVRRREGSDAPFVIDDRRDYWDRCLVDQCVLDRRLPVGYLYREPPDMASEGDAYPDSGWRIRGDLRNLPEAEIDDRELAYVALGAVLNVDDSWLHLIDEPIGSAFDRDFSTGDYGRSA